MNPPDAVPRRGHLLFVLVFLLLLAADLVSKEVTFDRLAQSRRYDVWDGVFEFKLARNPGMMWGMAQEVPAVWWVAVRGAVLCGLFWLYFTLEKRTRLAQIAFGMVAAGALGNIADNVFQGEKLFEGEVRDFLHFYWFEFPTFNVADSCICVGAPLLLLVLWNHDRAARDSAATEDAVPAS